MPTPTTLQWISNHGFDADNINAPGRHNDTPLMLACRQGEHDIASDLIKAGANVLHRNMDGTDALWACVVSDSFELATELLAAGADINNQNDNGASVLMYASSAGKDRWVSFLLQQGADTRLKSLDDFSALELASTIGCLRLLKAATRDLSAQAS
ncbi:ankyrin repeat domain-containing protein [Pseudomaricurvus sp. HS19]|uniref:ankyrin repeat domain-containing protein n=1 Tax=Pseudomaricurvus sp. HS19 TaxID=2692626 RepID=UPI00136A4E89|nr:ankyrin repeat domain-containing protein [Pseudomaricurvus sp. HS19]MYM62502.1 ankyrin repeat domain-containing protein [Pseudomaricurvus sp. HS19]